MRSYRALIFLAAEVVYLDSDEANFFLGETGPIERASALSIFLSAGYMLPTGGRAFAQKSDYIIFLVFLFGCRELNFYD